MNSSHFPAHAWARVAQIATLAGLLALTAAGRAQTPEQRMPRIGFAYPAGGQQGTTFTVAIGGQNLNANAIAHFSPAGISARVLKYERPLNQKEFMAAQEKMRELQKKRGAPRARGAAATWTHEDERILAELREQLARRANRIATPALGDTLTLSVTIPVETPPGGYELRLRTPTGLSNPLLFQVGDLPEFTAAAITAMPRQMGDPGSPQPKKGPAAPPPVKAVQKVTLPAVVNGQILPGETDRIQFSARKGEQLIIAASARALIPYLADAVPGWFQATLTLFDSDGREIAFNDDFNFNPDPVIACEIPADGTYQVEIKDAIYRGREDFVYRIAIGQLPFITGIFPLGARCGERATFELEGWNLARKQLTLETADRSPGVLVLAARNERHLSNAAKFALGELPERLEREPNDTVAMAAALTLPVVVNGRIDRAGDVDFYRFDARAGDELIADVMARRLNSPLDSVLELTDAAGRLIASNDDAEDKAAGLQTHHADSRLQVRLPETGPYFLRIGDSQQRGGSAYAYRLRVGPPEPDFVLRVTPASINVRGGACVPVTVHAVRRDGFDGEIMLELQAPTGFTLSGGRIPAGKDKATVTLAAPPTPRPQPYSIRLRGTAEIGGKVVSHIAVPADDQMQAFFYRHLVPSSELLVAITGRGSAARVQTKGPLKIAAGSRTRVQLTSPALRQVKNPEFELVDPPEGIAVDRMTVRGETAELVLSCDPSKMKSGLKGNLLFNASAERAGGQKQKGNNPARVPFTTVPAIPFEIVGSTGT